MVPDRQLIMENMLMAEGFVEAKMLAKKFAVGPGWGSWEQEEWKGVLAASRHVMHCLWCYCLLAIFRPTSTPPVPHLLCRPHLLWLPAVAVLPA